MGKSLTTALASLGFYMWFPLVHVFSVDKSHSATLWTVAHQAPLFRGFSRQEYWSGLPCPSPGDLSNPGMELATPESLGLQAASLLSEPLKKPISYDESVSCSVMFNFLQLHGSSQPRDWTQVFHIAGRFFTIWATQGMLNR